MYYNKKRERERKRKKEKNAQKGKRQNTFLSSLRFKQSSLLAGYTIKISRSKDGAMCWCFISILFIGQLYYVIIMQECHLEEICLIHRPSQWQAPEGKITNFPPPLASVCLLLETYRSTLPISTYPRGWLFCPTLYSSPDVFFSVFLFSFFFPFYLLSFI